MLYFEALDKESKLAILSDVKDFFNTSEPRLIGICGAITLKSEAAQVRISQQSVLSFALDLYAQGKIEKPEKDTYWLFDVPNNYVRMLVVQRMIDAVKKGEL